MHEKNIIMTNQEELLDIVDHNDSIIGLRPRSEIYAEGLSCFRVVNLFLENTKGQIWIPRRIASKSIFPLCLDMSMGGDVSGVSAFMKVYRIFSDNTPAFNPDDFVEYFWLKPEEVLDRIANGDKAKDDLPILIKFFYFNLRCDKKKITIYKPSDN